MAKLTTEEIRVKILLKSHKDNKIYKLLFISGNCAVLSCGPTITVEDIHALELYHIYPSRAVDKKNKPKVR